MLLHGILGSERMWSHVVPLLADHYDGIAPTMLGHRGGRPATVRPARLEHVVDDAQRLLDELGLEQPHLAGNSLGARVALELARLGRQGPCLPGRDQWRQRPPLIPGARYIVLEDVGHVPMLDDPQLVAQTILAATATNRHGNVATADPGHGG